MERGSSERRASLLAMPSRKEENGEAVNRAEVTWAHGAQVAGAKLGDRSFSGGNRA